MSSEAASSKLLHQLLGPENVQRWCLGCPLLLHQRFHRSTRFFPRVLDANMISQCASAVDNFATYYFKHITVGESPTTPAALNHARHVAGRPGVFPEADNELRLVPGDELRLRYLGDATHAAVSRACASAAKNKGMDNYKQGKYADAIKWLSWAVILLEKTCDGANP